MSKEEKVKQRDKYEGLARLLKMIRPDMKLPIHDIATELFQADMKRMDEQKRRMMVWPRQILRTGGDVQSILDIGR